MQVPRHDIAGPGAWVGPDVRNDPTWLVQLSGVEFDEIGPALRAVRSRGLRIPFEAAAFPLPSFSALLDAIQSALEDDSDSC